MSSAISQLLRIQTTSVVMFTTESSLPSLHQLATPLPPRQIQILNLMVGLFSQTHLSVGVIKNILVSISCVTFNLDACKVSCLYYL